MILAIIWVAFGYYFTSWYNNLFSMKKNKIHLLIYSTIVFLIGTLLYVLGLFNFYFIYKTEYSGVITPTISKAYNNMINLVLSTSLIILLANLLEFITYIRMFNRINYISAGKSLLPSQLNFISPKAKQRFCTTCGAELEENSTTCSECGSERMFTE